MERKFRAICLQRRGGYHCAPVSDAHAIAVAFPDANSVSVANSLDNLDALVCVIADPDSVPYSDAFFVSNANAVAESSSGWLFFRHLRLRKMGAHFGIALGPATLLLGLVWVRDLPHVHLWWRLQSHHFVFSIHFSAWLSWGRLQFFCSAPGRYTRRLGLRRGVSNFRHFSDDGICIRDSRRATNDRCHIERLCGYCGAIRNGEPWRLVLVCRWAVSVCLWDFKRSGFMLGGRPRHPSVFVCSVRHEGRQDELRSKWGGRPVVLGLVSAVNSQCGISLCRCLRNGQPRWRVWNLN